MLLTPPAASEKARAIRAVERPPASGAQESRGDGWIVLGDLDAALYQSGLIDVLLERIARPRVIFGGGMSALNALLSLDGRALAFRIGWERIRAAHLLGRAALERAPLVRLRGNGRSPLGEARLASLEARGSFAAANGKPELRLFVNGGFVDAHADADGSTHATLATVAASVGERPSATALAAAVHAGVASGLARLLLLGVDARTVGSNEVAHAIDGARAASVELVALPLVIPSRPGVIGYLLPGLGRAERLIETGREAARLWLARSQEAET